MTPYRSLKNMRVEVLPDGVRVTVGSGRKWLVILMSLAMLVFWLLFAAEWIEDLLASWSGEGRLDLFHGCGVLLFSLGALGWLYVLAWEILGEQVVTLSEGKLAVALHLRQWQRVRIYDSRDLKHVRVHSALRFVHSLPVPLPYPGWELTPWGGIVFEYRGRTITFGFGVDRAQAQSIVAAITQTASVNTQVDSAANSNAAT